jgi:hypothetical protein
MPGSQVRDVYGVGSGQCGCKASHGTGKVGFRRGLHLFAERYKYLSLVGSYQGLIDCNGRKLCIFFLSAVTVDT